MKKVVVAGAGGFIGGHLVNALIKKYSAYPGAITSGSGGGYAMIASEAKIGDAIKIKVKY